MMYIYDDMKMQITAKPTMPDATNGDQREIDA